MAKKAKGSAGNGKSVRKVFYSVWDYEKKAEIKVSEPSRSERNRRIRLGSIV
ncbi:MAG: hypothetical protein WC503_00790 [Candidatus Shapirobacteria bacterium]